MINKPHNTFEQRDRNTRPGVAQRNKPLTLGGVALLVLAALIYQFVLHPAQHGTPGRATSPSPSPSQPPPPAPTTAPSSDQPPRATGNQATRPLPRNQAIPPVTDRRGNVIAINKADGQLIKELFDTGRSDIVVSVKGKVKKVLSDDNEGSRHQKFIVEFADATVPGTAKGSKSVPISVLVAHNIDLAPRVPLDEGDEVTLKAEYEWSEKGGVLHWTHRDPGGRHAAGSITHKGRVYQ